LATTELRKGGFLAKIKIEEKSENIEESSNTIEEK